VGVEVVGEGLEQDGEVVEDERQGQGHAAEFAEGFGQFVAD
jgi:hypothetical protein